MNFTLRNPVAAALAFGLVAFSTTSYGQTSTISEGEATLVQATSKQPVRGEGRSIRPFTVHIPQAQIDGLRRRIAATQWPEKETVADQSQGVPLAAMQELARYWATDYDWRKVEAKLNALPQFITEIDGLDIHFIHVRSKHENALPLIVTHGWPGSILEQLKIIDPLPPAGQAFAEAVVDFGSEN
jgi:hypothetical protein